MENTNSEYNLIFVAGGLNTRFNEYSRIPKLLLPYKDNDSILIHNLNMIEYREAYIIVHQDYFEMVENYVEVNDLDVTVIPINNSDGSFWAIKEATDHQMWPTGPYLFVWSDIIFKEPIRFENTDRNVIGIHDGDYRYHAEPNRISNASKNNIFGNVPGVYILDEFDPSDPSDFALINWTDIETNYDLIDWIKFSKKEFGTYDLPKIVEFRDIDVYIKEMDVEPNGTNPRFFNRILINSPNILTKECIDSNYVGLIQTEMAWYKEAARLGVKNIPNIEHFGNYYMHMEYLRDYVPLDTYLRSTKDFDVFNDYVLPAVHALHAANKVPVDSMRMLKDTNIEFYDKVLKRVGSIQNMILDFDYTEFTRAIHKAYTMLMECLDARYGHEPFYVFTHGDLNGSNTMINPETKDVKFIDPRGYYGESKMNGLAEYDMAKLNYFLHGYDHFNNGFYLFADKYNFDVPECIYKASAFNNPIMDIMLGFIYINLSSYISNNVMKANISYHHGMNILNKVINENE